ncbi:MAG: hypothetical protein CMM25_00885 [Rhodospirillaceae bacterium]|nr:hypothetical protein [Rhodospirillaceae bacterium]
MFVNELDVLRWLHIVAMVYWLGGEWGVFQTSYNVINHKLSMEERRRHMETAYRIDILARSGIILLLPLGLHMGFLWELQPYGGSALIIMWAATAIWFSLCWGAFIWRETDRGIRLTIYDERVRFVLIPSLFVVAICSLLGYGPFIAEEGDRWYSLKILIYTFMLCIGLYLRFVMREWTAMFRILASGPNIEVEHTLERSIRTSRYFAYIYWIGILSTGFLGATKLV